MYRPTYHVHPADLIDVEVVNPDGSRALVRGRIAAVPETCTGHQALKIVVEATSVRALSPPTTPAEVVPLRLVSSTEKPPGRRSRR